MLLDFFILYSTNTDLIVIFQVRMITWLELTAELLVLLQWRYDSLNANQCTRQQAFVLWRTFQPRIPLAPFLSECYCSDLQCDGDGEHCGFWLFRCRKHRQLFQESCTRLHWSWNTSDYSSRYSCKSRYYQHSRRGGRCPDISSQSHSSKRDRKKQHPYCMVFLFTLFHKRSYISCIYFY